MYKIQTMSLPNDYSNVTEATTTTAAMPPVNNELMKLYNRIKDLYGQLGNEKRALQIAQQRLATLQHTEQKEQRINDQYRRQLLQCVNARNNIELEIFHVRDQIEASKAAIAKYDQERDELESKLEVVQEESKTQIDTVYAPQQLKMDLYLQALTDIVQAKMDHVQQRDQRLATVRAECEAWKAQEATAKHDMERAREEIAQLSNQDHSDQDVSVLSARIQEVIKEVSPCCNLV
jgi:chromosome segregation ATPase